VIGHYARYLAGWAVVGALLMLALTFLFTGVAGDAGTPAVIAGVLVVALTDLVVFAIVLRALAADAERFPKLWGLSVALKALVIGSSIALVAFMDVFPVAGFVQILIVSFVVFSHHEIFWLLVGQPRRTRMGATRC
jgi:hypothetical protein